jgi:hypothetical protein
VCAEQAHEHVPVDGPCPRNAEGLWRQTPSRASSVRTTVVGGQLDGDSGTGIRIRGVATKARNACNGPAEGHTHRRGSLSGRKEESGNDVCGGCCAPGREGGVVGSTTVLAPPPDCLGEGWQESPCTKPTLEAKSLLAQQAAEEASAARTDWAQWWDRVPSHARTNGEALDGSASNPKSPGTRSSEVYKYASSVACQHE